MQRGRGSSQSLEGGGRDFPAAARGGGGEGWEMSERPSPATQAGWRATKGRRQRRLGAALVTPSGVPAARLGFSDGTPN